MNEAVFKYLARIIIILTAIPVHETAHAYVSYLLGDPTAKEQGRLTLNPLKHFDPIGTLCLLVTGIGWAKPVPIDVRYYKNRKLGMALSALAGPVSNFIMAFLSLVVYKIIYYASYNAASTVFDYILVVFYYMIIINIALGIFNLIPVPPFDGSRILFSILPDRWYFGIMKYERYIFVAVFLILTLTHVLDEPLSVANAAVLSFFDRATYFIDKIAYTRIGL